jgi:NADH-quinone oxidoreductase subunit J
MENALFYVFAGIALLAAVSVVVQRRGFFFALSLLVCLCAVAGLYMLLQAQFIAAVQVIVYAGAIMVLFLFIIMLLDPFSATVLRDKRKFLSYLAVLLGATILALLYPMLRSYDLAKSVRSPEIGAGAGTIQSVGQVLFTEYLLPFEITSVLILVAIMGAVVIAKRQS